MIEKNDWVLYDGKKYRVDEWELEPLCGKTCIALDSVRGRTLVEEGEYIRSTPVVIHPMPNTAVHVPTQEDYDNLMETLEKAGWEWWSGHKPTDWNGYTDRVNMVIVLEKNNRLAYGGKKTHVKAGYTILTFNEFIEKQLQWGDEPRSEKPFKITPAMADHDLLNLSMGKALADSIQNSLNYILGVNYSELIPSPQPTMGTDDSCCGSSVLTKARNLFLSAESKLYRKHGIEDNCGNPTETGLKLMLEQMYRKKENRDEYIKPVVDELEQDEKKK